MLCYFLCYVRVVEKICLSFKNLHIVDVINVEQKDNSINKHED